MSYRIYFNRPTLSGNEQGYMADALALGHISGDGVYSKRCQALLEQALGAPKALLTTSCTHALEMSALLLDLKPGDEVIIPSYAFVTTANAFVLFGARPVFADVRPDTLNLDERLLEGLITPRTRAIVPLHYGGIACDMDRIMALADAAGALVLEDNAHGLFGAYRGKPLGSFGALATQSFHETKNFYCGEGGALILNDESLVQRAEILREKGTNRSQFFRGQVDKYTWVDLGSSYLPSDLLAAFLLAQLESREQIQAKRRAIWDHYDDALAAWADTHGVQRPFVPDACEQTYHMYWMMLPSCEARDRFIAHMKDRGILAVFHYQPLHCSAMGRRLGGRAGDCPVAEQAGDRLVRLPLHNGLSQADLSLVVESVLAFEAV